MIYVYMVGASRLFIRAADAMRANVRAYQVANADNKGAKVRPICAGAMPDYLGNTIGFPSPYDDAARRLDIPEGMQAARAKTIYKASRPMVQPSTVTIRL